MTTNLVVWVIQGEKANFCLDGMAKRGGITNRGSCWSTIADEPEGETPFFFFDCTYSPIQPETGNNQQHVEVPKNQRYDTKDLYTVLLMFYFGNPAYQPVRGWNIVVGGTSSLSHYL